MKRKISPKAIVLVSLFTAMVTVLTLFVKVPVNTGYVHIGDGVIYLAACLFPTPLAIFCGALGGCLADILGGYAIYAIPTFIIKGLLVLPLSNKEKKIITKRNLAVLALCALITIAGYFIADAIVIAYTSSGSVNTFKETIFTPVPWTSALAGLLGNLIQAIGSSVVFIALGTALDKIKIKKTLEDI